VAHEHDGQAAVIPASVAEHMIFCEQARRNIRESLPLEVPLAAMETIDGTFDPPGPATLTGSDLGNANKGNLYRYDLHGGVSTHSQVALSAAVTDA
jgi:hypothetical protein